jgi:hypothetical protein
MVYNAITSNKLHAATIHGCFMTWFIVILNQESGIKSQESGIASRLTLFPVILVHGAIHAL